MSDPIEPFLGTWTLDPDESDYQQGDPPQVGTYRIEDDNGLLNFYMNWTDSSGADHSESFAGIPNGKPIQLSESGLVDSLVLYFESPNCLVSEAKREELSIMKAVREISNDGKTLTITQTVHVLTDQSYVNKTVYKKEDLNPF